MIEPPEGQKESPGNVGASRGPKKPDNFVTVDALPLVVKRVGITSRRSSTWKTTPTGVLIECTQPERGAVPVAGRVAAGSGPAPLPCLNSNNCNEAPIPEHLRNAFNRLSTNHRKAAFKLAKSVKRLCDKYSIERIGFLTLTFADHVTDAKEAGKRFHSLRTGVLGQRYAESICVLERMKSGRIHFHLLVVLAGDIRTGFCFEDAARGVYTSANVALRAEWAFWRSTAKRYGFGRTELMPVKSNAEGLHKYVGKYIAKHVGNREQRDKGVRLVRYSSGANIGSQSFSFFSPRSRVWRWQVGEFARRNGCSDMHALSERFGVRWAYHHRAVIMSIEPPPRTVALREVFGEWEPVTMTDIWMRDRYELAAAVAQDGGCTAGEAFNALFTPAKPTLGLDLPKWEGERIQPGESKSSWEKTIVWNDGRVERLAKK